MERSGSLWDYDCRHKVCKKVLQRCHYLHQKGFNAAEEVAVTRYVEVETSIPVPHILDRISIDHSEYPRLCFVVVQAVPEQHLERRSPSYPIFQNNRDGFNNYVTSPAQTSRFGFSRWFFQLRDSRRSWRTKNCTVVGSVDQNRA